MHAAGRGAASSSSSVLMRTVMIFRRRWRHRWQHLFLVFSSSLLCSPSSLLFLRVFDVHWRVHFLALSNKVAFQVTILLVYTRMCLCFEVKRVTNIYGKKKDTRVLHCSCARPKALVACDPSLSRLLREIIIVNSAKTR